MSLGTRHPVVVSSQKLAPLLAALAAFFAWSLAKAAHVHDADEHQPHRAGACILCAAPWDPDDDPLDFDGQVPSGSVFERPAGAASGVPDNPAVVSVAQRGGQNQTRGPPSSS